MSDTRAVPEHNRDIEQMEDQLKPMAREPDVLGVLQRAEIDQQIATAKRFPRSISKFMKDVQSLISMSESIAASCIYALPRDGKVIEGPSVRLAEILLSAWGNCKAGARVISEDDKWVTSQGIFYDLEKNNAITVDVRRRITGKSGRRYNDDMVAMTANAASSIALRNAILRGVPRAYWDDAYGYARRVVMGDFKTLPTKRAAAMQAFVPYGIKPEIIFAHFGIGGLDDLMGEHLVFLHGYLTAIKEDGIDPESLFPPKDKEGGAGPSERQPLQAVKDEQEKKPEPQQPAADTGKQQKAARGGKKKDETTTDPNPSSPGQEAAPAGPETRQAQPVPPASQQPAPTKTEQTKPQSAIDFGDT